MREPPESRATNRRQAAALRSPYRRAIQLATVAWLVAVATATGIGASPTVVTTVSLLVGIVLAGLVFADLRLLREAGAEWDVDRFIYYPAVIMLPVVAVVYLWDRRKRVAAVDSRGEPVLTDRLEDEMRADGQEYRSPSERK
ncbi:MAG: hypothetical protein ABEJ48_03630 [Halobacteriales archaeon]